MAERVPVQVRLEIPYKDDLLILPRLVAATTASLAGFDVEEIEDLRLAVYECCLLLGAGVSEGLLSLSFEFKAEEISVELSLETNSVGAAPSGGADVEVQLSEQIVGALVDSAELSIDESHRSARLVSRRSSLTHER